MADKQTTRSKQTGPKKSSAVLKVSHVRQAQPKRGPGRPRKMPLIIPVMEEQAGRARFEQEHNSKDDVDLVDKYPMIRQHCLLIDKNVNIDELQKALIQEERNTGVKNDVIKCVAVTCPQISRSQLESFLMYILFNIKIEALTIIQMARGDTMVELIVKYGMYGEEKSLRKLDFRNVEVGSGGVAALEKALSMPDCVLEELILFDCGLGEKMMSHLVLGLHHNTSLKTLYLEGYRMGSTSAKAIGNMLVTNQSLTSLSVKIDNDSLCYLAEGLKQNTTLEYLRLLKSNLGSGDVDHLADVNVGNTALSCLELERGFIEDEAMKDLEQIAKHPEGTIKALKFTCCYHIFS